MLFSVAQTKEPVRDSRRASERFKHEYLKDQDPIKFNVPHRILLLILLSGSRMEALGPYEMKSSNSTGFVYGVVYPRCRGSRNGGANPRDIGSDNNNRNEIYSRTKW